jgi:hypothetical protein
MNFHLKALLNTTFCATILLTAQAAAQTPAASPGRDEAELVRLHAEGAQLYECKLDSGNKSGALTWQFREPIAALLRDGKSVGQHTRAPPGTIPTEAA